MGPIIILLLLGILSFYHHGNSRAQAVVSEPALLIGQIKVTASNGQFITLYNNSAEMIDMSTVQLAYYNNYDLSKATSNKFISLSGKLAPSNYYLVSDGALFVCYKMTVNAVTLGFSTTAGILQVLKLAQATPGSSVSSTLIDSVAWSKTAAAGAQTLPPLTTDFLQRVWADSSPKSAGGGTWQTVHPSATDQCDLQTQIATSTTPTAAAPIGATPSVTKVAAPVADTPAVINKNLGLVAPELSELFPNPAAPQTDDSDEFIELYNPNDSTYDLVGYRLEAGASYSRGYTFSSGSLPAKSFTAFSIKDTKLQLSNTEGQVRLLSPEGTTISETAAYEDALENSSWSLVADSWQWSDQPTPGTVNLPDKATDETATTATTNKTAIAKKISTPKVAGVSSTSNETSPESLDDAAPIHPAVLAGVGLAAVGYALYEYRRDMANRIFQLRRYLRARRTVRT